MKTTMCFQTHTSMNTTQRFLMAALLGLSVSTGWCQTSYTNTFSINQPIPNGKLTGWSDTRRIKLPLAGLITNLQVTLNLSGGFNGDLYGYLVHGSGFAVLLNRPGRTATDPVGYADSGFDVSFGTGALNDIHLYQGVTGPVSPLTGLWAADGRETYPLSTLDTDSRTAPLDSFIGVNPTGDWTLFLADVDGGGAQASVAGWGLILMIDPGPVPLHVTAHGVNKIYDGNSTAAVTFTDDSGAGDVLTYTYTANFADKAPGVGKAVSVSDIVLGGPDASRYTLVSTTASAAANITPAPLTVTGIAASNKTYDGTTTATINTGGAVLAGVVGTEDVMLNIAGATGAFLDKNVGTGKTVQVSGLTVSGGDTGNYSLTQPTATANITQASLNVSASGTLVYGRDPTNAVYAPVYYPLLGSDTTNGISGRATFSTDATNTSYVGSGYIVNVIDTGTLTAGNYTFAVGTNGIMTVTPAPLAITNATANNKGFIREVPVWTYGG